MLRRLALAPEHCRLRWILLLGLAVRVILAPLTSWDFDTPGFVQAGISTLYTGSPYTSSLWSNPPLAPFLASPLLGVPAWFLGPQNLVVAVSAIAPVTAQTGVNATYLPVPAALLAWKLLFILADAGVALLLYAAARQGTFGVALRPNVIAAAWMLNPLVIWASAVHGEIDSLAVLFVLAGLLALVGKHWTSAGLFLALAVFTKAYPIVLIPLALVVLWMAPRDLLHRSRTRMIDLGRWAGGFLVGSVAFLAFIPESFRLLDAKLANPEYGGLSVLAVFNGASPRGSGWYAAFSSNLSYAALALDLFRGLAVAGVVCGTVLVALWLRQEPDASEARRLRWIVLAAIWSVVGVLIADSVPEPENLLAVIPLALLALPATRWRAPALAVALLSAAGLLLYLAYLTPFAMFYPLAHLLGNAQILWVNRVVIGYVHTPLLQGTLWLGAGLLGGGCLLYLWARSAVELIPRGWLLKLAGGSERHGPTAPDTQV
ncbi:MAG TPA: hypothetical protein VGV89_00465 [Thermoplasmata archaeon]|nr:hypothetical protein [Thermoplasmata archaeon]